MCCSPISKLFLASKMNLSSKLPLGLKNFLSFLVKIFPFLTKASLFQKEKCFKTLPISSLFTNKAILTLFSTQLYAKAIYETI
jgi:hypothetical protein